MYNVSPTKSNEELVLNSFQYEPLDNFPNISLRPEDIEYEPTEIDYVNKSYKPGRLQFDVKEQPKVKHKRVRLSRIISNLIKSWIL